MSKNTSENLFYTCTKNTSENSFLYMFKHTNKTSFYIISGGKKNPDLLLFYQKRTNESETVQ